MVSWSRVPRFYSIKMFRKNGQTAQKILVTLPEFWIWIRNNWIFFCHSNVYCVQIFAAISILRAVMEGTNLTSCNLEVERLNPL